jgi:hypothetical protein
MIETIERSIFSTYGSSVIVTDISISSTGVITVHVSSSGLSVSDASLSALVQEKSDSFLTNIIASAGIPKDSVTMDVAQTASGALSFAIASLDPKLTVIPPAISQALTFYITKVLADYGVVIESMSLANSVCQIQLTAYSKQVTSAEFNAKLMAEATNIVSAIVAAVPTLKDKITVTTSVSSYYYLDISGVTEITADVYSSIKTSIERVLGSGFSVDDIVIVGGRVQVKVTSIGGAGVNAGTITTLNSLLSSMSSSLVSAVKTSVASSAVSASVGEVQTSTVNLELSAVSKASDLTPQMYADITSSIEKTLSSYANVHVDSITFVDGHVVATVSMNGVALSADQLTSLLSAKSVDIKTALASSESALASAVVVPSSASASVAFSIDGVTSESELTAAVKEAIVKALTSSVPGIAVTNIYFVNGKVLVQTSMSGSGLTDVALAATITSAASSLSSKFSSPTTIACESTVTSYFYVSVPGLSPSTPLPLALVEAVKAAASATLQSLGITISGFTVLDGKVQLQVQMSGSSEGIISLSALDSIIASKASLLTQSIATNANLPVESVSTGTGSVLTSTMYLQISGLSTLSPTVKAQIEASVLATLSSVVPTSTGVRISSVTLGSDGSIAVDVEMSGASLSPSTLEQLLSGNANKIVATLSAANAQLGSVTPIVQSPAHSYLFLSSSTLSAESVDDALKLAISKAVATVFAGKYDNTAAVVSVVFSDNVVKVDVKASCVCLASNKSLETALAEKSAELLAEFTKQDARLADAKIAASEVASVTTEASDEAVEYNAASVATVSALAIASSVVSLLF